MDKLVEINNKDWPKLRDLYLANWPENMIGYYTVNNFIRWITFEPNIKHLTFYSLNGDWGDGTFVAIDRYQLFINSLNETNEKLFKILMLLDWSHGLKISTFRKKHRSAVVDTVRLKNLSFEFDSETELYYLPKEDAAQINVNLPEGITLGPLNDLHAEIADKVWPNRHIGSTFFLKRIAKWNPCIGVFSSDGELIAWCFQLQAGPLGALQVAEKYLGKGFGTIVCKAISKMIGELGEDVYACVSEQNIPSIKMFQKIGFRVVDKTYWSRTNPVVPFEWRDD